MMRVALPPPPIPGFTAGEVRGPYTQTLVFMGPGLTLRVIREWVFGFANETP